MANDIMKLMEEVEEMIFTRMKEPIKKLEINEEYKQNLHYLLGFLDGIKFSNTLNKIA